MFSLINRSNEVLEAIHVIDTSVPGCRVCNSGPPIIERLLPGDELTFMGYEPGISYVIRPQKNPEQYRNYSGWTRNESKRAAKDGVDKKSSNDRS